MLTNVVHYCTFVNIANCYYIVTSCPKVSATVFSSELRMSIKQHKGTFAFSSKEQQRFSYEKDSNRQSLLERTKWMMPFRYDINFDTLSLGGIAIYKCTWSEQTVPLINFASLISQSFLKISPISFLTSPYIIFRRYFGIITMWYVQFHRVCAILWLSILDTTFR